MSWVLGHMALIFMRVVVLILDHPQQSQPTSISHISICVHLCETFFEVPANFSFFHYLFHLKAQPSTKAPIIVDGVDF
jgi:membrane-bound acyltransferase YfiQ involved in biofilm formation